MAGYIGTTPVPQATQHRESFTATGGQTSFATAGYTPQFIDVYLNGVKLAPADYTATNGSDVVLASGATASDILEIVAYTPFEVANQTFTGDTSVTNLAVSGNITLGDNNKIIMGAGSDLQLFHDGTNSFVKDAAAGDLILDTNGDSVRITHSANGETMARFQKNNKVELYYDNALKLATTSTGIDVTGDVGGDSLTINNSGQSQSLLSVGGGSTNAALRLRGSTGSAYAWQISSNAYLASALEFTKSTAAGGTTFSTPSMILDNSGNVLVGKTSTAFGTDGTHINNSGYLEVTNTSGELLYLNRLSNDGDLIRLFKDSAQVGSIGVASGHLTIGDGDLGLIFNEGSSDRISPWNISTGASRDDAISLGETYGRFKDLYLSGGVYLGGTGSANKLSEYDQGSFTPTWDGYAPASTAGAYVRIGQMVYVSMKMVTASSSDFSGVQVNNLPFTVANETAIGGGMVWADNASFYDAPNLTQLLQNTTQCILKTITSSDTYGTREYVGRNPQIGGSTNFTWNIIYRTND